ncbi:MAG: glycosyltransferase, partial [Candidatus Acidiferrales bacterium]
EVVVDGESGVLVPPAHSEALADALIALLQDPERQRALGEAGARRARDIFSLEQQIRETATLYERLLEARQPQRARRDFALS